MSASRVYIAGITPKRFARAAARAGSGYKTGKLNGYQLSAAQRRREIESLAKMRLRSGSSLGAESGWIECIANALRVRHGTVDAEAIRKEAARIGMPAFRPALIADAVEHIAKAAWGRYELFSPQLAGDKLQLTAAERDACDLRWIAAIDETSAERRRRKDKERKAEQRAASAALAQAKVKKVDLAKALGISRPTLDGWIEKGLVNLETGEVPDFTNPVRSPLYLRYGRRTKNVKSPI